MKKLLLVTISLTLLLLLLPGCSSSSEPDENNNEIETVDSIEDKEQPSPIQEESQEEVIDDEPQPNSSTNTDNPYNPVDDIKLSYQMDYAHIDMDSIRLGNDETAEITIITSPSGLTVEDLTFFTEDDTLLEISHDEPINDTINNTTTLTSHIKGIQQDKSVSSTLFIFSSHEYFEKEDETSVFELPVIVYNATDGKVVYVTTTGEKYHYSKEHAGDGAIATTMRDALAYEYEACGTCVD